MKKMKQDQFFANLQEGLKPLKHILSKATDSVLDQEISNYPIFIVHSTSLDFGIPLVERNDDGQLWSVHVSTLEEFVLKSLIEEEKVAPFKEVYKDPTAFFCLFVIENDNASFVFMPRG